MSLKAYPNVRKTNKFQVFLEGLLVSLVNEVKLPEDEIVTDVHAAPGEVTDMTTPAGRKWGEMTLKTVVPADAPFTLWRDWMDQLVDPDTGAFGDVEAGARVISVIELGLQDVPLDAHSYLVFPTKVAKPEMKGGSEGKNVIDEVTLTVIRRMS
ncbi:MAG: phage tail protein [Proteobacteria bacterium]|nr:phage tail protein [Pseudomonadota bacterium]